MISAKVGHFHKWSDGLSPMSSAWPIDSNQLSLTSRGAAWVEQFDSKDREAARTMLNELTLVSHNEFERALTKLILDQAKKL